MSFDLIPSELRSRQQWCSWQYEDSGNGKPTKVPYNPFTRKRVSSTRPDTWLSFDDVKLSTIVYDGIGFLLNSKDPYCFIDLDYTEDPEDLAFQKEIVESFNSYSERSPSGKGLHIICKGEIPCGHRSRSVEIYSCKRYMTMTGDVYKNLPINNCESLCLDLWKKLDKKHDIKVFQAEMAHEPQTVEDDEIFKKARNAQNGIKFLDLWNGDFAKYYPRGNGTGDQSAADFALIDMLAFYTKNPEQIKRLFFRSKLSFREKARRDDYVNDMIRKSFDKSMPPIDFGNIVEKLNAMIPKAEEEDNFVNPVPLPIKTVVKKLNIPINPDCPFELPPGLTGQITSFILNQSYKPVQEISIMAALAFMAGVCGKAYNVSNSGLNLYLLLLADTGRGKEAINQGISKLVDQVRMKMPTVHDFIGPSRLASGQGLLRYMSDHRLGSVVSIFGEFGYKLKAISDPKATSAERMVNDVLLDFYNKSAHGQTVYTAAYSDSEKNTKIINAPAFSMIGETVPKSFYEMISTKMIESGFLPRLCIHHYRGKRPPSNYDASLVIPDPGMIELISSLCTQAQQNIAGNTVINVKLTKEASDLDREMDKEYDAKINDENELYESRELWNRVHMNTKRVAALLAVGENFYVPTINKKCWDWARKFVEYGCNDLVSQFDKGLVGGNTGEQKQFIAVTKILRSYLVDGFEKALIYCPALTEAMYKDRVVPYGYLQRRCYSMSIFNDDKIGRRNAIRRAVAVLIDGGELIELEKYQTRSRYNVNQSLYMVTTELMLALFKQKTPEDF